MERADGEGQRGVRKAGTSTSIAKTTGIPRWPVELHGVKGVTVGEVVGKPHR